MQLLKNFIMSKFRNKLILLFFILANVFIIGSIWAQEATFVDDFSSSIFIESTNAFSAFGFADAVVDPLTGAISPPEGKTWIKGPLNSNCAGTNVSNNSGTISVSGSGTGGYWSFMSPNDDLHLVWNDNTTDSANPNGRRNIFYSYFDASAGTWQGLNSSDGVAKYDNVSQVDNAVSATVPVVKTGPNNLPHIMWTETSGKLYYSYWNGSVWTGADNAIKDRVDVNTIGWFDFAVDSSNQVMAAFAGTGAVDVDFRKVTSGNWDSIESIGHENLYGTTLVTLLVDSLDVPHVVFGQVRSGIDYDVAYSHRDGGSWKTAGGAAGIEILNKDAGGSNTSDLRFSFSLYSDKPYVAYYDKSGSYNKKVYFTRWDGSNWVDAAGTGSYDVVSSSINLEVTGLSMVIDATGKPNIAFGADENIYFTKYDGGWKKANGEAGIDQLVTGASQFGNDNTSKVLVLNGDGQPSIAYIAGGAATGYFMNWSTAGSGDWTGVSGITSPDSMEPNTSMFSFLFKDSSNVLHLIYYSPTDMFHTVNSDANAYVCGVYGVTSTVIGIGTVEEPITQARIKPVMDLSKIPYIEGPNEYGILMSADDGTNWCWADIIDNDYAMVDFTQCNSVFSGIIDASGTALKYTIIFNSNVDSASPVTITGMTMNFDGMAIDYTDPLNIDINGTVDPILKFDIVSYSDSYVDTSTCALGTLVTNTVASCQYRIGVGTNGVRGFTTYIQDTQTSVSQQGLRANSYASQIDDIDPADYLVDGDGGTIEEYGLRVASTPPTGISAGTNFTVNQDKPIPYSSADIILSASLPIEYIKDGDNADTTIIKHSVIIQRNTPAGYYTQTIRYTVTGNF